MLKIPLHDKRLHGITNTGMSQNHRLVWAEDQLVPTPCRDIYSEDVNMQKDVNKSYGSCIYN